MQLGDPALLNGLSLRTCCFLIFWMLLKQGTGNHHGKTEKEKWEQNLKLKSYQ